MDVANSKNNIPVRLTEERWQQISAGHPEMASYYNEIVETIENPGRIYQGNKGELIAVGLKLDAKNKFIVVVYKETTVGDGFVITAYLSNKEEQFEKKILLWKRQ